MIFNRKNLRIHRDRAALCVKEHQLFHATAQDIIERLDIIEIKATNILDVGCRTGILSKLLKNKYAEANIISTDISSEMLKYCDNQYKLQLDEENINLLNMSQFGINSFDLITFSLGLHWINDVVNFLKQIYDLLSPNGIFIMNFVGGKSLKMLRSRFTNIEEQCQFSHPPHISPFIHFDHVTPLLQQVRFYDIIVDYEEIKLEYKNIMSLIMEVKNIGESNILVGNTNYSITKKMLSILKNDHNEFVDNFDLISCIVSKNKNSIKLRSGSLDF